MFELKEKDLKEEHRKVIEVLKGTNEDNRMDLFTIQRKIGYSHTSTSRIIIQLVDCSDFVGMKEAEKSPEKGYGTVEEYFLK